jgi:hypothetical protein
MYCIMERFVIMSGVFIGRDLLDPDSMVMERCEVLRLVAILCLFSSIGNAVILLWK